MRSITLAGIATAALLSTCVAATAATLIPVVPVSGSTFTGPFGINNSNIIAGNWYDDNNVEHGYYGTLAGSYTTFDYTGNTAAGTEPRNINDNNLIVGFGPTDGSGSYVEGPSFQYDAATNTMTTITEGKNPIDGVAQGLNAAGEFSGDHFIDQNGTEIRYGYQGVKAKWKSDLSVFGSTAVAARGINKAGTVVGTFVGSDGNDHGFILLKKGTLTQVDFPNKNEQYTFLEGINDNGLVTGQWEDNSGSGLPYAFELDTKTNTFTSIKVKGSTYQQAFGVNNAGLIAINSDVGDYIYCPGKAKACPQADGIETQDGPGITVPAGGWLHLAGPKAPPLAAAPASRAPVGHGPGEPMVP